MQVLARNIPILLVDDDETDIEAARRALKKANISNPVYEACDGVEALSMLTSDEASHKLQPCIILLDINMPRMNGLQLLRELREKDSLRHSIVFMLTTSPRPEDIEAAYKLNVAGYLLKENLHKAALMLSCYCEINEVPGKFSSSDRSV